jgi:glycosyltransferase involved in cell wall biosynthesis
MKTSNIYYIYNGEDRIDFGNVAALALGGYNTYLIHFSKIKKNGIKKKMVQIRDGLGNFKMVEINNIYISPTNYGFEYLKHFEKPDLIIYSGINYPYAFKIADMFGDIKKIYYQHVLLKIFKNKFYCQLDKRSLNKVKYSLKAVCSTFQKCILGLTSDYTLIQDILDYRFFSSLGFRNLIYTPIIYSMCYNIHNSNNNTNNWLDFINQYYPYVLSIITLKREDVSENMEKYAFKVIYNLAIKQKNLNFIIIGSNRAQAENVIKKIPTNIILLGKIYDDKVMKILYENSLFVIVPFHLSSNRIIEGLFYYKPILTTCYPLKLFKGLKNMINIVCEDSFSKYNDLVSLLINDKVFRDKIRENAKKLYNKHYTYETFNKYFSKIRPLQ